MKNSARLIFISLCLVFLFSSCGQDNSEILRSTLDDKNEEYIYGEVVNSNISGNINALIDENIVYSEMENQDSRSFHLYNMRSKKTEKLGYINDFYIATNSFAFIDNGMFLSVDSSVLGSIISTQYRIDISGQGIRKISSERLDQALVYTRQAENVVLSLKSKMLDGLNIGETYIELYNPQIETKNKVVSKLLDVIRVEGQSISLFDFYQDNFFVLVRDNIDLKNFQDTVEVYNMSGDMEYSIILNNFNQYMYNQVITDMRVASGFLYFRNASGDSVIMEMNKAEANPVVVGTYEFMLEAAVNTRRNYDEFVVFFIRDSNEIVLLDCNNKQMIFVNTEFDTDFNRIKNLFMDGENLFYSLQSDDGSIKSYFENIGSLISKENTVFHLKSTAIFSIEDYSIKKRTSEAIKKAS